MLLLVQNLIVNDYAGWDFRVVVGPVDREATLTGFSFQEMYGHFCHDQIGGHSNQVVVIIRLLYNKVVVINEATV